MRKIDKYFQSILQRRVSFEREAVHAPGLDDPPEPVQIAEGKALVITVRVGKTLIPLR